MVWSSGKTTCPSQHSVPGSTPCRNTGMHSWWIQMRMKLESDASKNIVCEIFLETSIWVVTCFCFSRKSWLSAPCAIPYCNPFKYSYSLSLRMVHRSTAIGEAPVVWGDVSVRTSILVRLWRGRGNTLSWRVLENGCSVHKYIHIVVLKQIFIVVW